jgi:hypothetical protein
MTDVSNDWTARRFSQSNPKGMGQVEVATRLRRVATTLDDLVDPQVRDITFHCDVT